jgi:hypothetical protein
VWGNLKSEIRNIRSDETKVRRGVVRHPSAWHFLIGRRPTRLVVQRIFEMDDSKTQIRNPKYQIGRGNGSDLPIGYVYVKPRQGQSVLPCVPVQSDISDFGI